SSRRRHTRSKRDWSSDVCSSDLTLAARGRPHKILTWHDYALAPGEVTTLVYRVRPSGHTSAIRATTRARTWRALAPNLTHQELRSEERRVGKEGRPDR